MEYTKLETLLVKSKKIIDDHLEIVKNNGEDFNIFSILGMETNETKTHSAMLVALLDPKGNHYYEDLFLKLFLEEIGYDYQDENLKLTKVKAEHHLGRISKDYEKGGYIDILITFNSGKAIAIENKIYAGDQPKQMYRYSLFKGNICTLYYLNLFGNKPTKESLHTLKDDDYEIITYKNQILNWLDKCLSIIKPTSLVQNAVKQYQVLIKNLTNSMDKHLSNNLNELIATNLKEAKYIHLHYQKMVEDVREKFRNAVFHRLNDMQLNVKAFLGNDATYVYSQIWLRSKELDKKGALLGLESFSGKGHNNGRIFVGIFDRKNSYDALKDGDYRLSNYWTLINDIKTPENNFLNLSSTNILEKLLSNPTYFENMVSAVATQTKTFVDTYHDYYFLEKE